MTERQPYTRKQEIMNPLLYAGLKFNYQKMVIRSRKIKNRDPLAVEYECLNKIYSATGITPEAIKSNSRKHLIVEVRCIAIYHIKMNSMLSLKQIGLIFGKDHSTIIYNLRLYDNLAKYNAEFKAVIKRVGL